MDEIVKKIAGLGLPGILIVIVTAASGGSNVAVVAIITSLGQPFGLLGGLGLLGLLSVVGDAIAGYGIENLLKLIYTERRKTESVRSLLQEIKNLPISDELKIRLKNHLSRGVIIKAKYIEMSKKIQICHQR
jgi:hypothetical protein